jgi:hypothetical protein
MSELVVGPFLGVIGGLAAQRLYDWLKDEGNKKTLKESLKNELEKCIELLTGQGNLLPTMMWNSTVTSGDVKLLSFNDRTKLSQIYFNIENHNYEAKRVRDIAVMVNKRGSGGSLDKLNIDAEAYWKKLSVILSQQERFLKEKIATTLKDPLWSK